MQFKHKLIYFALGCAFVVIGQVLLSVVVPKVTAQGKKAPTPTEWEAEQEAQRKKETVEFDTVKVRSLQVVDASGKVCAILEKTPRNATVYNVIRVFNRDGTPVYSVAVLTGGGVVGVYSKDGKYSVDLIAADGAGMVSVNADGEMGASMASASGQNLISVYNGSIGVFSNDMKKIHVRMEAHSDAGAIIVNGSDGIPRVIVGVDENGGRADFWGNDNKTRVGIGVNEYGHGAISTWDKHGYRQR